MNDAADHLPPRVDVDLATREQAPILANLLELYVHDFSEFCRVDLGEDGRFGYARLPLYWSEPGRHPFLIRADDQLAGLALVKKGSEISSDTEIWDIAEFFILRGWRRRGVGMTAAQRVWSRFPGRWEVRVQEANIAAALFWKRAIAQSTGKEVEHLPHQKNGKAWRVFSFAS